ncbi:hypothetical protein [Pseudoalteromonas sp. R3]|uniref:hypothetical protein n=1 Tax=Pseudoalteromonas sp. R3 TaxID=1709477 RepID=UPI0006B3FAB9|nr:hypothetical protein [Pseudoalteromonas sp. R3]AZZ97091.1 hypothetical protein ELR70_07980 [Pseudoalteromonas sp. R3]
MSFTLNMLRMVQLNANVIYAALIASLFVVSNTMASPGAHGPNGEHLDTRAKVASSTNPKFESFTETFELAGELFENELVIYLHDFKTNTPVAHASVDLELGNLSASAEFSEQLQAYVVTQPAMLSQLKQPGLHEIVLTILTEHSGDLLVANLENHQAVEGAGAHADSEHDEHHHDLPWLMIALCIGVFVAGLCLGRISKERK